MALENKLIFNGKIICCWWEDRFGDLMIGSHIIAEELSQLSFKGRIHLRYMVSNSPIRESLDELWIKNYYGILEADHYGIFGSEWTGQYDVHEEIIIGGHNLLEELSDCEGKYCCIEIWENDQWR